MSPDLEQPRKYFDEKSLNELAQSIKERGLLQPILVRPDGDGKYKVVHGERRYRAHVIAKTQTIKCFIKELDPETVKDIQLIENLERDNLSDIELAYEFQRRVNGGKTHDHIARSIGKTRSFVTQRLALLQLPKEIQDRLLTGALSFSNARELLAIKDPALRNEVSQQVTETTTVMQTLVMIKQQDVHCYTCNNEEQSSVEVKDLAVFHLVSNRERVKTNELLAAIGHDLRLLRGE